MRDNQLEKIAAYLRERHKCHTLILYGSRARGDATPESDYDLICFRKGGSQLRDAKKIGKAYLDAFVYPDDRFKPSDLIRAHAGKIVFQKKNFGDALLLRLARIHARGPKRLPEDEIAARIVWAQKMLDRAKRNDAEGNFRRVWLLTALLEDYFALRHLRYEGPETSLRWLKENDPAMANLFEVALQPAANLSAVKRVTEAVISV